jgi:hypothetical protein
MRTYRTEQGRSGVEEGHLAGSGGTNGSEQCRATNNSGFECHNYCWDYDMSL